MQMEQMQYKRIDPLKNYGSWFQNRQLRDYKPPRTVLQTQCINPAEANQDKEKTNLRITRGFHFQKAKKPNLFTSVNSPGPAFYDLLNTLNRKKSDSKTEYKPRNISMKLKSNSKDKSQSIGVGSYDIDRSQLNKRYKDNRFGKAERITCFQQAIYNGSIIPAPGQYEVRIKKSQSLYALPKVEKSLPKQQNKVQKLKKSASIGPWSYQIKRSQSVKCFTIMKNPYQNKDQIIQRRIDELKKKKENIRDPGPGKYLKIEQWGKFNKTKQLSNGLNIISRPYLRIYN